MIRKIVESPDLYNLILEKAGDKPETELSVKSEPRITRKVAKYDKFKPQRIQGGSEIWACLDFEWSKRGWVANNPDFKWDLKFCQKPSEIWMKMFGS